MHPGGHVAGDTPFALVIFDCDGVLVDSERITNAVFRRLLAELGLELTLDEVMEHFVGRSQPQCLARIAEMLGHAPPAGFAERYTRERTEALREQVQPIPGIERVLDRLDRPFCVASSGDYAKMRVTLGRTGLLPRFEGRMFSVVDVPQAKPAPDVFLYAARSMGTRPADCAVVEDTTTGVRAAVAAGMTVFAYTGSLPAARLREAGAHHTFDHMRDLPGLLHAAHAAPGPERTRTGT